VRRSGRKPLGDDGDALGGKRNEESAGRSCLEEKNGIQGELGKGPEIGGKPGSVGMGRRHGFDWVPLRREIHYRRSTEDKTEGWDRFQRKGSRRKVKTREKEQSKQQGPSQTSNIEKEKSREGKVGEQGKGENWGAKKKDAAGRPETGVQNHLCN